MSFLRHISRCISLGAAVLFLCVSALDAVASESPSAQMEKLLKEHPELILDVLKEHSEEVLDIVQKGSDRRRRQALLSQWESDIKIPKNVALDGRPVGGTADAPVTIIAFSDFVCAYCHQAAFTLGNLMKRYPGKIRLIFKQVPKDDAGRTAGFWFLAAYNQDKAKAWKLYALAFDRQQEVEADAADAMRRIAQEVGLDVAKLENSLKTDSNKWASILDGDAADARALGFVGTPYFLVNNMVLRGALPMENFVDAVEMALKQKAAR